MHKPIKFIYALLIITIVASSVTWYLLREVRKNEVVMEIRMLTVNSPEITKTTNQDASNPKNKNCNSHGEITSFDLNGTDSDMDIVPINANNKEKGMLVKCLYEANDTEALAGLYVTDLEGKVTDTISPTNSIEHIFSLEIKDINHDGSQEISFQGESHGGSCSWQSKSLNIYDLNAHELFSRYKFAEVDKDCIGYEKEVSTYSGNLDKADQSIISFLTIENFK